MAANLLVRRSAARLRCLVRSQVACFTTERSPSSEPFITTGSPGLRLGMLPFANTAESIFAREGSKQEVGSIDPHPRSITTMADSYPDESMPEDEAYFGCMQYCKKYNLFKDTRSIDEILDDDKKWQNFYHPTKRYNASIVLWHYWQILMGFGWCLIINLFKEHVVKHCSHRKIPMDEAFKFKEAFSVSISDFADGPVKFYYLYTYHYRHCRTVPKWLKASLLRQFAEERKELIKGYTPQITDEIMREIEDDITKRVNEIIVKEKKGKKRKGKEMKVNGEMVVRGDPGMATPR